MSYFHDTIKAAQNLLKSNEALNSQRIKIKDAILNVAKSGSNIIELDYHIDPIIVKELETEKCTVVNSTYTFVDPDHSSISYPCAMAVITLPK